MFNFFILGWYSFFLIALKAGSVMSELAILLARALSIFQQVYSLLFFNKFKFTSFSASSSSLITALLLLFKVIDSLWKAFSEKRWLTVFQNFLLPETALYGLVSQNTSFSLAEWLKPPLDSSSLFLRTYLLVLLFIIAFLSSFGM